MQINQTELCSSSSAGITSVGGNDFLFVLLPDERYRESSHSADAICNQ